MGGIRADKKIIFKKPPSSFNVSPQSACKLFLMILQTNVNGKETIPPMTMFRNSLCDHRNQTKDMLRAREDAKAIIQILSVF